MGRLADCSDADRMGPGAEEFHLLCISQAGSEDAGARVDGKIFRLRRCWDLFCGYQLLIVVLVDSKIMASCGKGFTFRVLRAICGSLFGRVKNDPRITRNTRNMSRMET